MNFLKGSQKKFAGLRVVAFPAPSSRQVLLDILASHSNTAQRIHEPGAITKAIFSKVCLRFFANVSTLICWLSNYVDDISGILDIFQFFTRNGV